jgi:hypothetical protein
MSMAVKTALAVAIPGALGFVGSAGGLTKLDNDGFKVAGFAGGTTLAVAAARAGDLAGTNSGWLRASPAFGLGLGVMAGAALALGAAEQLRPAVDSLLGD